MPGRPSYDISREQLQFFIDIGFNVPQIKVLLLVSTRTVERHLAEYGITTRRSYSCITNAALDVAVHNIKTFNPNCGSKNLIGYLAARGIKVPRQRVRDSLRRIDRIGVYPSVYNYTSPCLLSISSFALWHLDGNHKLIRWRFVVHGCVDGFSCVPVFLKCNTNNQASTVLRCFIGAVDQWGLPSRIRSDRGGENIDVVRYMIERRGTGRGSALVGRTVHNQRIQRLWRDVFKDVLYIFHDLFYLMESVGILDTVSEIDLWCLQFSFLSLINYQLTEWVNG